MAALDRAFEMARVVRLDVARTIRLISTIHYKNSKPHNPRNHRSLPPIDSNHVHSTVGRMDRPLITLFVHP